MERDKTPKTREQAQRLWEYENLYFSCFCHIDPPCSFCVNGFSLPLDEYLDTFDFEEETPEDAYDRAMTVL